MKLKEKIRLPEISQKNAKKIEVWLKRCLWGALAFLLGFSSLAGGSCPFAVSLTAASGMNNFVFSAVGAGLGYIISCDGDSAVRYFSAVIICSIGAFAINFFKIRKNAFPSMLISFLSVLSTGIVITTRNGADPSGYALTLGESALAMASAFFFYRAVNCDIKKLRLMSIPITDATCIAAFFSIILASASKISIYGVSPSRVAAVIVIISAVRCSQKWGLIVSLCLGFAFGISSGDALFITGAYAFSALICSLFSSFSSLATGVVFTLSITFFAVCADAGDLSVWCVAESFLGSLIACLLPEKLTSKIAEMCESETDIAPQGNLRQSLVVRLRFASSALAQVSESVRAVREKINKMGNASPDESEIRMVAADQFFSISDMLSDLAFEFDEAENFDFKSAEKIRRLLGEYEIFADNISVICDKYGRTRVEISTKRGTNGLDSPRLKNEICRICKREFEKARLSFSPAGILASFMEKPNFKMEFGFSQYCAEGNLCGDTIKTINDSRGHMIFIISDGMGKGARAALDGAMGAGLLSKLLCAGFGFDSSLKVVNSALFVKSSEESLATLDCARIDLFSGKCEFYKAGAPKSYIIKQDRITKCELTSMPAGILRGIEFAKRTTMLNTGDEIVMMSDGITDSSDMKLNKILISQYSNPNEKAAAILECALNESDEKHRDDMSVIVAKIKTDC